MTPASIQGRLPEQGPPASTDVAERFEIPAEILQAHEDGHLVLFCGAGVSKNAGYPMFRELVEAVEQRLDPTPTEEELGARAKESLDRRLYAVEVKAGVRETRQEIRSLLTGSFGSLRLHRAILELGRTSDAAHRTRLVTTNFDLLFERAADIVPVLSFRSEIAPRLAPVDLSRWDSLIYLHGRLDQDPRADGVELILTSADFGRAYLEERWAARFVVELFESSSVLFIGYSAEDPVFRYLLDAFASRRSRQGAQQQTRLYALADCASAADHAARVRAWTAKGVEPVIYVAPSGNHEGLVSTLEWWASRHRAGQQGKRYRLRRLLEAGPSALVAPDYSELRWALSDTSGNACTALFDGQLENASGDATRPESMAPASATWLPFFDQFPLLDDGRLLAQPYLLSATRSGSRERLRSPLVGGTDDLRYVTPLGSRAWMVAEWISRLAVDTAAKPGSPSNSKMLLDWVLDKGGSLHPDLVQMLRWRIEKSPGMEVVLREAWTVLIDPSLSASFHPPCEESYVTSIVAALAGGEDGPWLRTALLHLLTPFISLPGEVSRRRTRSALAELTHLVSPQSAPSSLTLADCFSPELVLRASENMEDLEKCLVRHVANTDLWAEIAPTLCSSLSRALALFRRTSRSPDALEGLMYPAISGLGTGVRRRAQWTLLADALWTAGVELDRAGSAVRLLLLEAWSRDASTTLRRLALKAATEWTHLNRSQRGKALFNG